jgi:hypothetical protein
MSGVSELATEAISGRTPTAPSQGSPLRRSDPKAGIANTTMSLASTNGRNTLCASRAAVVDDHGLPKGLAQRRLQHAHQDVGQPTRRKRDNEVQQLGGSALGFCDRRRREQRRTRRRSGVDRFPS